MTKKQFKEVIVYIAQKCSSDDNFGVTKLNKILFFADSLFYLQNRKPLTGVKYIKDRFGPVPQNIETIKNEMTNKDIAIAYVQAGPYIRHKVVALRDPDISSIEPEMIALLTSVIDHFCSGERSRTASWMSDFSHQFVGWDVTEIGEEIPYQAIYLENKHKQVTLTEGELCYGKELALRYNASHA